MSPDLRWHPFDPTGDPLPDGLLPGGQEEPPGLVVLAEGGDVSDREWSGRTALRLAREWAHAGRRVFVADASLEDPLLHRLLGEENHEGISDALLYGVSVRKIARAPAGAGFYFAPAGTVVADPAEVLEHPRWESLAGGFRGAGATLLVYLPVSLRGAAGLLGRAGSVVLLGASGEAEEPSLETSAPVLAALAPPAPELVPEEMKPDDLAIDPEEGVDPEPDLAVADADMDANMEPEGLDREPEPGEFAAEDDAGADLGGLELTTDPFEELGSLEPEAPGPAEPADAGADEASSGAGFDDPEADLAEMELEAAAFGHDDPPSEGDEAAPAPEEVAGAADEADAAASDGFEIPPADLEAADESVPSDEPVPRDEPEPVDEWAATAEPGPAVPPDEPDPPHEPAPTDEPAPADQPTAAEPARSAEPASPAEPAPSAEPARAGDREAGPRGRAAPRRRVEVLVLLLVLVLGAALLGWYYGALEIPGVPPADEVVLAPHLISTPFRA